MLKKYKTHQCFFSNRIKKILTDTYKQIAKFRAVKDELHLRPIAEAVAITIRNRISINEAEQLAKERGDPPPTINSAIGVKKNAAFDAGVLAAARSAAAAAAAAAAAEDDFEMIPDDTNFRN